MCVLGGDGGYSLEKAQATEEEEAPFDSAAALKQKWVYRICVFLSLMLVIGLIFLLAGLTAKRQKVPDSFTF